MPRVCWSHRGGRPVIELTFHPPYNGGEFTRTLLADTGAGSLLSSWDVVLSAEDCRNLQLGEYTVARLGGALTGAFPTYFVEAIIPSLRITRLIIAVAIPAAQLPPHIDGIAGFRFLNAFTYGNFGDGTQFCLETP